MTKQLISTDYLFDYVIRGSLLFLRTEGNNIYGARDKYNNTLLHVAVESKQYSIIEYLLSLCGDNNSKVTSLRSFLKNTRQSYVDLSEIKNNFGNIPFDLAIKNHDMKAVKLFTDHNINKRIWIENNDKNILRREIDNANIKISDQNSEIINLKNENVILKNDKKRLRDENDTLTSCNKKLKTDIITYQNMLKKTR